MAYRDSEYLDYIRRFSCKAAGWSECGGDIEAHHHGTRGMGQKTDDYRTIPLCTFHHREFHNNGSLFGWSREMFDSWVNEVIIRKLMQWIDGGSDAD